MLDALMPKAATFIAALVSGVGTLATSAPEIALSPDAGGMPVAGWTGIVLGAFSVAIAVTGMAMAFMDKRKVAEADTNLAIIKNNEKTIAYLENQNNFLRKQIEKLEADVAQTRHRSHDIADAAHAKSLAKEMELATLRAYMKGLGVEVPEFPHQSETPPVFPENPKHETQNIET